MAHTTSVGTAGGSISERPLEHLGNPTFQAYRILHIGFTVAPIIAGADKFAGILTDWDKYMAPALMNIIPFDPHTFLLIVGVIEIAAGLLVAFKPRIGGMVVSVWLLAIILNLLMIPGFYDVALRDLGLSLGALALSRLATAYERIS